MRLFDSIAQGNRPRRWPVIFLSLLFALALVVVGCSTLPAAIRDSAFAKAISMGTDDFMSAPAGTPNFVPVALGSPFDPTATPTPTATIGSVLGPPLPPPIPVRGRQPVDFEAARATAQAQGKDIAFVKIGFHLGPGGNANGWGDYVRKLDSAGVPVFVKSVDVAGPIYEVQEIMKQNEREGRNVPHILVYRSTRRDFEEIFQDTSLSPELAAQLSWQANINALPSELDKNYFWLETINEQDPIGLDGSDQIDRLARFSLEQAKLAVAQGYKYAALSFSTGLPRIGGWPDPRPGVEPNDWANPAMLEFLRYAAAHKDHIAIALHEYSFWTDYIAPVYSEPPPDGAPPPYPFHVGRFQALFDTVDRNGIARPNVMITEWGWEYNAVPEPEKALEDIAWASRLYAAYPEVLGAAIWYLGAWPNELANQTQRLIAPLADFAASNYFIVTPGIGRIDPFLFAPNPPTLRGSGPGNWPTPNPRPSSP